MFMETGVLISAFLLGFLGSFHCAGMCGPIALALPLHGNSQSKIISGRLFYNFGRIATYSILGVLAGLIGYSISVKGFQSDLSILTGVVILVGLIISAGARFSNPISSNLAKIISPFKNQFRRLFGKTGYTTMFLIGALNGILPCGFVYLALAAAATTGSVSTGAGYMFLFGLGTLPMMFSLAIIRNYFSGKLLLMFNKAIPVITIAMAVLLIYRGSMMKESDDCCKRPVHKHQEVSLLR